jgi:MinD-like ATPase involved in chromosome partitioning or flagellar assembly
MQVVPASLSVTELEGTDLLKLPSVISSLEATNDFLILDSSPGLGREALASLKSSREVLFVTTPIVSSVLDIVRAQGVLREINVKPIGIVVNMATGASYEMRKEEIEQLTGLKVIVTIPYDKDVYRSTALKQPIFLLNPNNRASKELVKLAAYISGVEYFERKSFFEKIADKFRVIRSYF